MWGVKTRTKANNRTDAHASVWTIADLAPGERAQIACLDCPHARSCERLTAYGLVQGQFIHLVQKHPAFVVRVDETELAFDEQVARCIQVHRSRRGSS